MPHVVCEPCVDNKCSECVEACPVEAFHEGERMLYINPERCIDCRACAAVCPALAIFQKEEVPSKWGSYITLNAEMAIQCPQVVDKRHT